MREMDVYCVSVGQRDSNKFFVAIMHKALESAIEGVYPSNFTPA